MKPKLSKKQLEEAIQLLRLTIRNSRANRELKVALELEPILAQREAELNLLNRT